MYQINMSINEANEHWFRTIEQVLTKKLKQFNGIVATNFSFNRLNISFACENENKINVCAVIKECLMEMYSKVCKLEYMKKHLKLPMMNNASYLVLLHTLVAFDRETENELLNQEFELKNNMALDGFYNFRLKELRSRWNEICLMAADNAYYLNCEDTLNELLRFLISAVNPKMQKLEITQYKDEYKIYAKLENGNFEIKASDSQQLMVYLIDIAPLELVINGKLSDARLLKQLTNIFDAKTKYKTIKTLTLQR